MIKEEVKEDDNKLRDFVDNMVSFKNDDTEIQAVMGLSKDLDKAKEKLTSIGQLLNDSKEQIIMPNKSMETTRKDQS
eukprot:3014424-Heterocapsa_arctica.AAC.1